MEQSHAVKPVANKTIIAAVLVVLALIGGFVGGMQYQKGKGSTALASGTSAAANDQPGMGGRGFNRNGSFGTVTAVSSSSITVKNDRTGETKAYSISGSTTITNNGATASASDITVGDTVMVTTSSTTSTDATDIRLNPTIGGAGGPGMQQGADTITPSTTN